MTTPVPNDSQHTARRSIDAQIYGNLRLRAVVYRGESAWVARTLEHDIAAFADHPDDLPGKLRKAIAANLLINARNGREGLEGIPPAPAQFVELDERAKLA